MRLPNRVGKHRSFGRAHIVAGLKTVKKRLGDGNTNACRIGHAPFGVVRSRSEFRSDHWPVAGLRQRHAFIGGAQAGACGIEIGIVLIGQRHRLVDRFRINRLRRRHHRYNGYTGERIFEN